MATKIFPGVIFAEDSGYSINFPDIPGAHSDGDTVDQCIAMGQEVLNLALEAIAADKREIPEPSTVEKARKTAMEIYPEGKVLTVQLVSGTLPERTQKYTITFEPELMRRVDAAAGNYGRSGWLAEAARERLMRTELDSFLERAVAAQLLEAATSMNATTRATMDSFYQRLLEKLRSLEFRHDKERDIFKAYLSGYLPDVQTVGLGGAGSAVINHLAKTYPSSCDFVDVKGPWRDTPNGVWHVEVVDHSGGHKFLSEAITGANARDSEAERGPSVFIQAENAPTSVQSSKAVSPPRVGKANLPLKRTPTGALRKP